MKTQIRIAVKIFVLFTILLGLIYPLFITGITQLAFPEKANGSLIGEGNKVIGSRLIGQKFDSASYFLSRPSVIGYNPLPSGASNLGPASSKLKQQVADRAALWVKSNPAADPENIPAEMLFASASGLDPHISPKAAFIQVDRIAEVRQLSSDKKQKLIQSVKELSEAPQFGFLGEERVNVLLLNLNLDKIP